MNSSPNSTISQEQLASHITQDITTCEGLLQLLAAERQALKQRDLELLDNIIEQKSRNLTALEESARLRARWVKATAVPKQSAEQAWQSLLSGFPSELQERWQTLKNLFVECQVQNDVNGKIIARKQTTYNQMLGLVRGQPSASKLYTAKGAARHTRSAQDLGEA